MCLKWNLEFVTQYATRWLPRLLLINSVAFFMWYDGSKKVHNVALIRKSQCVHTYYFFFHEYIKEMVVICSSFLSLSWLSSKMVSFLFLVGGLSDVTYVCQRNELFLLRLAGCVCVCVAYCMCIVGHPRCVARTQIPVHYFILCNLTKLVSHDDAFRSWDLFAVFIRGDHPEEAPSFFAITDSQLSSDLLLLREPCKNHFFSDISLCHKVLGNGF